MKGLTLKSQGFKGGRWREFFSSAFFLQLNTTGRVRPVRGSLGVVCAFLPGILAGWRITNFHWLMVCRVAYFAAAQFRRSARGPIKKNNAVGIFAMSKAVPLDVPAVLGAESPASKSIDFSELTYSQVQQVRTGLHALRIATAAAFDNFARAQQVESGPTQEALLSDFQACCFRVRSAMRVIVDVTGG